jgi:type IV secretion system protein TrbE
MTMALYQEFTRRLRWRAAHVSDKIPWRILAAPGVMLHKQTNALQRTYAVRGPDLAGETKEVQGALMLRANNVLKRLGGSWTIHSEAQRVRVTTYPESVWAHPVAALIDGERRRAILDDPGSRETFYFLTLTWQPPPATSQRLQRLVVSAPPVVREEDADARQEAAVVAFVTQADYLMDLLKGMLAMARPLTTDEMLTYLHNCVSDRWHPIRCPWLPIDLDVRLCDSPFLGGWYPQLGDWHLRTCSVMAYPPMSFAGVVRALEHKDLDFRWCTRWIALDRHIQAGLLRKTQGAWVGQERSLFARIAETISKEPTRMLNTDATNKAAEADAARQEIGADIVAFGEFTATVTVWDADPQMAEATQREVMQVLDGQGFVTTPERQHATAAWLSSHPGNRIDGVRRTPQHSLTLAHLCPGLNASWRGPERDEHLDGPPWFLAHTEGSTLFRVVNHVNDWGHFLVLGPTRSGKSVLAAFMVAQWLKYRGAQVFWFDVDQSARCLTLLLGGHWYDLGSGQVGLQPYGRIDEPKERRWVHQWTLNRLVEAKVPLNDDVRAFIADGLDRLARAPAAKRTFTEFVYLLTELMRAAESASRNRHSPYYSRMKGLVQEEGHIVHALQEYTGSHISGQILDADHDDVQERSVHTFEQRPLLSMPRLIAPVMEYVFHRCEHRFDTNHPTLLPMDEAALTWAIPEFEQKGKESMMTTAKKNVSLGFFTHSLSQVFDSRLGPLLLESCPTRFILPNKAARAPQMAEIYARMGLNEEEIGLIATARPQREYYFSSELLGKRLFTLNFSPLILSCLARNTTDDHARMDAILRAHGREGFAAAWLREQGFPEAAARIEEESHHAVDETDVARIAD